MEPWKRAFVELVTLGAVPVRWCNQCMTKHFCIWSSTLMASSPSLQQPISTTKLNDSTLVKKPDGLSGPDETASIKTRKHDSLTIWPMPHNM